MRRLLGFESLESRQLLTAGLTELTSETVDPRTTDFVTPVLTDTMARDLTDGERESIQKAVRESTDTIWFEKNAGQFPEGVLYGFRTSFGATLVYQDHLRLISRQNDALTKQNGEQVVDIRFTGSNRDWTAVPGGASTVVGSYQQADGMALRPDIFNEVTLHNVYDGVDLRLYSADKGVLEFDWIVARAEDYRQIRIAANGQDGILFNEDGSATLDLRFQDLAMKIPESYQVIDGAKHSVNARMVAAETTSEIRYEIVGDLVNGQPLVIDPNILWSTYFDLNSNTFDAYLYAVAADANGVYCFGWSNDTITNGSFGNYMNVSAGFSQGTAANQAYIYRLDISGTSITAWTSTGITEPTSPPSDLKLFPDGRVLAGFFDGTLQIYSADLTTRTFSGEPVATNALNSLAIVDNNSFYVGGNVAAAIPSGELLGTNIGPDATFNGSTEGVIIRYSNAAGTPTPDWATYVGGNSTENFTAIVLTPDLSKLAFTVHTDSTSSLPGLVKAVDSTRGTGSELLVGVLNQQATKPTAFNVFSYLGGSGDEGSVAAGTAATVITATNSFIYVAGTTSSTDLPGVTSATGGVGNGAQTSNGGNTDIFISRIPLNGNAVSGFQSTYVGGSNNERVGGIAYDSQMGEVLLLGTISGTGGNFSTVDTIPASNFYDSSYGGSTDIIFGMYSNDLTKKEFASYIGGGAGDYMGDSGVLLGAGHLSYSNFNGLTYVGATTHSRESSFAAGALLNVPGMDKTKSNFAFNNGLGDSHMIFAISAANADFGDAPASYENGDPASEGMTSTLRIGATIDGESGPLSSSDALGDDASNSGAADDEDGVSSLPQLVVTAKSYSVNVSVLNSSGAAKTLRGWIDFNRDGAFQANEMAAVSVPNSAAQQIVVLNWTGLSGLVAGPSYLRVRLSNNTLADDANTTDIDERSIGAGNSGEVEDYALPIASVITLTGPATVGEGASSTDYTVQLDGASLRYNTSVTFTLKTHSGTATEGTDFNALVAANLGFTSPTTVMTTSTDANGVITVTVSNSAFPRFVPSGGVLVIFTLRTLQDTSVEGNETYSVTLASDTAVVTNGMVNTTITDDDSATWSITGSTSVDEGASASYSISLDNTLQAGEVASVQLSLADGPSPATTSADHANFSSAVAAAIAGRPELAWDGTTLTFTSSGSAMTNLVIGLATISDTIVEGTENYTIKMSSPGSTTGAKVVGTGSVQTAIIDNNGQPNGPLDSAIWSITGSTSVDEGATASYTVSLSGALQAGETATITFALSDISTTSADYGSFSAAVAAAIGSRTDLSFTPGVGLLTYNGTGSVMPDLVLSLAAISDGLVEVAEQFRIALSAPGSTTGANVIGTGSVVTTINDETQHPPVAGNDVVHKALPGAVTQNVTSNDTDPENSLDWASVDLNPLILGRQTSFTVSGEGVWTVDDLGNVTFSPQSGVTKDPTPVSYVVKDLAGLTSNMASIAVDYRPISDNDGSNSNVAGQPVTIKVVANDTSGDTVNPAKVKIYGTANPGDSLVVTGEGTWSVNTTTGAITFTPLTGFTQSPTAIRYSVEDYQGNVSNTSLVTVGYTQACNAGPFALVLDDPSTPAYDVIVVDDMPVGTMTAWGPSNRADLYAATKGYIYFSGAVGTFSVNRTTAKSKPVIGTDAEADIAISSTNQSTAAGTVVIWATDTCFQISAGAKTLTSPTGGNTNGSLSFQETLDLNNRPFATPNLPNTITNQLGAYGAGAFSGTKTAAFNLPAGNPFSITKKVVVTHPAGNKLTTLSAGGTVNEANSNEEGGAATLPYLALDELRRGPQVAYQVGADLAADVARQSGQPNYTVVEKTASGTLIDGKRHALSHVKSAGKAIDSGLGTAARKSLASSHVDSAFSDLYAE